MHSPCTCCSLLHIESALHIHYAEQGACHLQKENMHEQHSLYSGSDCMHCDCVPVEEMHLKCKLAAEKGQGDQGPAAQLPISAFWSIGYTTPSCLHRLMSVKVVAAPACSNLYVLYDAGPSASSAT